MEKLYRFISSNTCLTFSFFILFSYGLSAQQVSTFDDLVLAPESFWDGSDLSGGFQSGDAYFHNFYNADYALWFGFIYSNSTDVTTNDYTNGHSAITGKGYNGSANYAVATDQISVKLLNTNEDGIGITGFYVTNVTYAALSMKEGDMFAKKFGGTDGNDPDWFLLTIDGYLNKSKKETSVEFYLADFRFEDNSLDYILDHWAWVDLSALGNIDSLTFSLSSSDNGEYGMNTPAYFAMDNFNDNLITGITKNTHHKVNLYPNPVRNNLTIELTSPHTSTTTLVITDIHGTIVYQENGINEKLINRNLGFLHSGMYVITIESEQDITHSQFIKY